MNLSDYRVIQGCPARKNVSPFIAICVNDAYAHRAATLNSVYRGADAESILHLHGKSSQAEVYRRWLDRLPGALPANPPGFSTHEMKSDGVVYPLVPRGHDLPHWWMQGFDVNDADVRAVIHAAWKHHWQLFQPYHSNSEFHHLNFRVEPKPHSLRDRMRIARLRRTLPRH